jgi:hypothetical protein
MADTTQNALEGAPIEFLVVDDENGRFAQWSFLRGAEGGSGYFREPDPVIQASRIWDR